jgi:hypothetical protein
MVHIASQGGDVRVHHQASAGNKNIPAVAKVVDGFCAAMFMEGISKPASSQ